MYYSLKFCISHSYDMLSIKNCLQKQNIPFLTVESDLRGGKEQIITRMEAFFEML